MENQLTSKEAAEYLGVTDRTVREWRKLGKGPKWHDRGYGMPRIYYKESDLIRFQREVAGGA